MGRPKGSKNKKGTQASRQPVATESPNSHDHPLRMYTYIAASCGCSMTKPFIASGGWCKHSNSMIRVV